MSDDVDVLVVGAGPSGSVAAHTLATRGFSVKCLEQGDWVNPGDMPGAKPEFELLTRSSWAWDPNVRGRAEDYPLNNAEADIPPTMFGAVGGSSVIFGAHWMRLLPSDFRLRSLDGICDDWPISYDDVEPFYREVDAFIGVSGLGGDPAYPPTEFPMPPMPMGRAGMQVATGMNKLGWHWWPGTNAIPSWPYKHMAQCVRWGVCERGCPAGAKASFDLGYWPHATRAGAELVTGARVARVTVDRRGLATGATWFDRHGGEHQTRASAVILAANGIGTPRVLLMSNDHNPDGLANSSGVVGRNLMMHPGAGAIGVYDEEIQSWHGPAGQLMYSLEFYETDVSRGFYRGSKWNLMPIPGVLNVLETFKERPFEERWGSHLHELARYAGKAVGWFSNIEDLPEPHNRVTLDPDLLDSTGLPCPRIHYRYSENTKRNLEFANDRMMESHEAAGAVHTFLAPKVPSGHLLGTARMGKDPETSVVDSFGRSHDVPNLFIVDGSVMVTCGAVNPTATIAALALRCARHIAETARDLSSN
ncbi:MAG TPA: GMC family oxidoreductase [Solirubrobacteraceae bacterium]|nr:GMC family oxidoreductase [Solirubrobacteraceae bacterium]